MGAYGSLVWEGRFSETYKNEYKKRTRAKRFLAPRNMKIEKNTFKI